MVKCEFNLGVDDLKTVRMVKRFVAEFLGMFIYISLLFSGMFPITFYPFTNGALVASVLVFIRPVSGGHINPAITIGSLICCYISLLPALFYIIAQICGALLGQLVAKEIAELSLLTLKQTKIAPLIALEILKTFLVVSVAMSISETQYSAMRLGPLAIGVCVAACITTTTDYRAMMNPAASLAAAMFYDDYSLHWVFWVGPIVGAILAGIIHVLVFRVRQVEIENQMKSKLKRQVQSK